MGSPSIFAGSQTKFLTSGGITIPSLTTTARLALSSVPNGTMVYDSTLGQMFSYLNAAWATQISSAAPLARYNTAAGQTITNDSSFYIINFDTSVFDNTSSVTTGASWKFTAPLTGYYYISTSILFDTGTYLTTNVVELRLFKNGTQVSSLFRNQTAITTSFYAPCLGEDTILLNAGDYIDVRAKNNATGGNQSLITNSLFNYINIFMIQQFSNLPAGESIGMSASNSAGTTIVHGANFTSLTMPTVDYDSTSSFNSTTGVYTIPVAGKYLFTGQWGVAGEGGATELICRIVKNGSAVFENHIRQTESIFSAPWSLTICKSFNLAVGDTLALGGYLNSGGGVNRALDGAIMSIMKVG
jgi:hypothetical protein